MKLTFLGSAAAEGLPAFWCECDTCREARRRGGKDIRHRTAYLLDDDTLIDYGPDIFSQCLAYQVDWLKIRRVLITHAHEDHLLPCDISWRRPNFSRVTRELTLIGSQYTMDLLYRSTNLTAAQMQLKPVTMVPGGSAVDGDLTVLAVPANHTPELIPLLYVISRSGKKLLVANDTGMPSPEALELLRGCACDAAVIDGTMAFSDPGSRDGHMGAEVVVEFRDKLLEIGGLKPEGIAVTNHFTHNGFALHDRLEEFFLPKHIAVGYDGLVLEI